MKGGSLDGKICFVYVSRSSDSLYPLALCFLDALLYTDIYVYNVYNV